MPGPIGQALISHFDSEFEGPNGDFPAVWEALVGVTAGLALRRPAPGRNSIWQIVEHLIASKEWQLDMLQKGEAASPAWGDPAGGEAEWQATLGRLQNAHARLKAALRETRDEQLLGIPVPEWNRTLLELILSSGPAHKAHHSCQIDYLRGLLG